MPMVEGGVEFEKLHQHAIKLVPAVNCSVEEVSLAVGEAVGDSSVFPSWMERSLTFLDSISKISEVVENGVVIHDIFVCSTTN